MKNFNKLFFFFLLTTISVFAQSPEKMSYQAVIRDASNTLLKNQEVGMQISILQTTITGASVYTETQTTTTNINGLVSIEIGTGSTSDDFSAIDWSTATYFIKTETDPIGGSSYTITGTKQLMSVPFALYATTSGSSQTNATNIANNTTAIALNTAKVGITAQQTTDIINNNAMTGIISDQATAITANTAKVGITTYSIGDFAHGGIVFWVDETGQHGLVCAKEDQSSGVRWYAGTYGKTQAKGDGVYSGKANTAIIIAAQVAIGDDGNTYAARICNELQITEVGKTYGDWYLPSKYELNLMYQNKTTINNTASANAGSDFSTYSYWSSTEDGNNNAWIQNFGYGVQKCYSKYYPNNSGRAVRAF
jgi:hypothetical protein|tara:strand:+ start:1204 stop:2298 length:1095 start_codon:yes stop_codon:yes gene_type:complete